MVWLWWLGGALVLGVIETLTADLTFLMFAGGALGGALTAGLGAPAWAQVIVFAIVSTLLLVAVRPWAKRRLARTTPAERTNSDALVGARAIALTDVTTREGRVSLAGGEWSARLVPAQPATGRVTDGTTASGGVVPPGWDGGTGQVPSVPAGTELTVTAIDGAYALVTPALAAPHSPTDTGAHV